ncbi:MAG: 4Fe-4S dicluster domain-containing protein [Bacteroidales bacterium]|nr:4Fe-4S dicluster domain-containing protein [Bacteroidales bacterium]MBN2763525.1 4Fe-4S dicluster domain-containing protein [Bacteroidales bacterium]
MAIIDPKFGKKLKKYGAYEFDACYNCGSCTAVCSLSTEEDSFPREMVRFSVLGMKDDIKSSLKPWLCYYCGECTTYCPQTANPGELMMSLRRWLITIYDWTGLSGLLYKYWLVSLFAFLLAAAGVLVFGYYNDYNLESLMHYGHLFEMMAIAGVFAFILLPNIIRMWYFVILKPGLKISLITYIKDFKELLIHMFTQKRTLGCDDSVRRWFEHFILVISYLTLLFVTVFLNWFSTQYLFVNILGYVVSAVIVIVTIDFIIDRIRKKKEISKFSQPSDWLFVIWLSLMGFTAMAVRVLIDTGLLEKNVWLYLIHLIILVQWALIIVPFGKWTHFLYRSFAMYFAKLKAG